MLRRIVAAGLLLALAALAPAQAARPIVDTHKLDDDFMLFANDANVPWEPTSVRLDTLTDAPVAFSVYRVNPGDVLVAGGDASRAVSTAHLRPIASWTFRPPHGYRYQSSNVSLPLGNAEGFFVVEARRHNIAEQVWVNRTRIGLIAKENAAGLTLYGTDLGTGRPLDHLRVNFVVDRRFVTRYANAQGLLRWTSSPRPIFALAEWGASDAFVSILPEAPLPGAVAAVKTASAVVHAGQTLSVVGFVRTRAGAAFRPGRGDADVALRLAGRTVGTARAAIDPSGAFAAEIPIPANSPAGDYAVMAQADGASAGTTVHVDADADGLALHVAAECRGGCDASEAVPVIVRATRANVPAPGVPVTLNVLRSPHLYAAKTPAQPWGLTPWYHAAARTDVDGIARFDIPGAADGLASTFGVHATAGGASAVTRIVAPTARVALVLQLDRTEIGAGVPLDFVLRAHSVATGKPIGDLSATVQLIHGASVQQQTVAIHADGIGEGSFTAPQVGSDLVLARAEYQGRDAEDAGEVQVDPQTLQSDAQAMVSPVHVTLDRSAYVPGEPIHVDAVLDGAQGDALLTLESATRVQTRIVRVHDGRAQAEFRAEDAPGLLAAGAAFVRNGRLLWNSVPVALDAPGRPAAFALAFSAPSYEPEAIATVDLQGVRAGAGTLILRVTRTSPTGSAYFGNAPDLLAFGGATTEDSAAGSDVFHPWVDSGGGRPVVQTFQRRGAPPQDLTMANADTASVTWRVLEDTGDRIAFAAPKEPGRYVVTVMKIMRDGRVGTGTGELVVR